MNAAASALFALAVVTAVLAAAVYAGGGDVVTVLHGLRAALGGAS